MTPSEWIALGSLIVAFVAVIKTSKKENKEDTRSAAEEKARTTAKLDSISNGVDDIRVEYRAVRQRVDTMATDLAAVKSSVSSAHHRLDGIETRLNHTSPTE